MSQADGQISTQQGYRQRLMDIYKRNLQWAKQGEYQTKLTPEQEKQFLSWVTQNRVPFDPKQSLQDYDMRGFWLALQNKDPRAATAVNPNDKRMHFPDVWKTPYHESFSAESMYALPSAPKWDKSGGSLVDSSGQVIFQERKAK